jgi:hypothetical protein
MDWIIKHTPMLPVGPGKNFYANLAVKKIFVAMLNFYIIKKFEKWFCSEIMSNK